MTGRQAPDRQFVNFVCAASVPDPNLELLQRLVTAQPFVLQTVLELATAFGTLPAVTGNLLRLYDVHPLSGVSRELLVAQADRELKNAMHILLHWEMRVRQAIDIMVESGLERPLVLKGGGTKYTHYPAPYYRSSSDLDILVEAQAGKTIIAALVASGYSVALRTPKRPYSERHNYHIKLIKDGFAVEVHTALENSFLPGPGPVEMASHTVPIPELHVHAITPTPPYQLTALLSSALREGFTLPLRDLVDLHLLVSCTPSKQLPALCEPALRHRYSGVMNLLFAAAGNLFGTQTPAIHDHSLWGRIPDLLRPRRLHYENAGFLSTGEVLLSNREKFLNYLYLSPGPWKLGAATAHYAMRRTLDELWPILPATIRGEYL
jgi:hypothetical protein